MIKKQEFFLISIIFILISELPPSTNYTNQNIQNNKMLEIINSN